MSARSSGTAPRIACGCDVSCRDARRSWDAASSAAGGGVCWGQEGSSLFSLEAKGQELWT